MLEHLDHCPMCVKRLADVVKGKRAKAAVPTERRNCKTSASLLRSRVALMRQLPFQVGKASQTHFLRLRLVVLVQ